MDKRYGTAYSDYSDEFETRVEGVTIVAQEDKKISALTGFTIMVNVLLGTGPIFLPGVFLEAGVGLSSVFMVFISFISYLTAEYVIETISICNALKHQKLLI